MSAPYSDDTKQDFLDQLARCGVLSAARAAAGIKSHATIHKWRETDEAFSEAYDEAMATAADSLETEARRRAVEGVVRVKHHPKTGEPIDEVQYSDTLLLALLKAKKPSEFAERTKTELSGPDGKAIETNDTANAARLMAILEDAKRRKEADNDPLFA
jgi:hypothetical protein